jgi:hypothetical protein
MPIIYTNRKGRTYCLCQGVTKAGKPRYYFATTAKGNKVERIPEGYAISESVNGVVSLAKERPSLILEREIDVVKNAVQKHPQAKNYRVSVKSDRIEIYEHVGTNLNDLFPGLQKERFLKSDASLKGRLQEGERVHGQFTPVMRFILYDKQQRIFRAQRMCYRGSIDAWIDIGYGKSIDAMTSRLIPKLGTDAFFELF